MQSSSFRVVSAAISIFLLAVLVTVIFVAIHDNPSTALPLVTATASFARSDRRARKPPCGGAHLSVDTIEAVHQRQPQLWKKVPTAPAAGDSESATAAPTEAAAKISRKSTAETTGMMPVTTAASEERAGGAARRHRRQKPPPKAQPDQRRQRPQSRPSPRPLTPKMARMLLSIPMATLSTALLLCVVRCGRRPVAA